MGQFSPTVSVTEIETAIQQLPKEEIQALLGRLQDFLFSEWEKQIAADAESGKLDSLIAEAEAEIEAGNLKSLDEVINNA